MTKECAKKDLIENNFFFLDSDNLKAAESKLYGFCVANTFQEDGEVYSEMETDVNFVEKYSAGTYVLLQNIEDKIYISQDCAGCYGLYLYEEEDYFAVSNSFLLLVEKLKGKKKLSLNYDYANMLYVVRCHSVVYKDTLVNEIEELPRNVQLVIDVKSGQVEKREIDHQERMIELDSEEGIQILDQWFYKWVGLIRYLLNENASVTVDLSGGIDSRLVFLLFLNAGVDWSRVCINSFDSGLHTHDEDFAIATEIAQHYGLQLNQNQEKGEMIPLTLEEMLGISLYAQLGYHKEYCWQNGYRKQINYSFCGYVGECIRDWAASIADAEPYVSDAKKKYKDTKVAASANRIMPKTYQRIKDKQIREMRPREFAQCVSKENYSRYHGGKMAVEAYCTNEIKFAPLMDGLLWKLRSAKYEDENILIALIFSRYCPELLKFRFNNNHGISEETMAYARDINEKYPLMTEEIQKSEAARCLFVGDNMLSDREQITLNRVKAERLMYRLFQTESCKKFICENFHEEIWEYALENIKKKELCSLREVYAVLAVYLCGEAVADSIVKNPAPILERLYKLQTSEADVSGQELEIWAFPFDLIEKNAKVILYGAGNVGDSFYDILQRQEHCSLIAWVDKRYEALGAKVESPEVIRQKDFDYIVIAVAAKYIAMNIKEMLMQMGVEECKILWRRWEK